MSTTTHHPAPDPTGQFQVTAVRAHPHRAALVHPFVTAARRTDAVDYAVVDIDLAAADGPPTQAPVVTGQGSAAETVAVTGEDAASILAAVTGPIRSALLDATGTVGELAARIATAVDGASSARAAADVALHDAWARTTGRPLVDLLAGTTAPRHGLGSDVFDSDMTVSLEDPQVMAARARDAVADGYRLLKIKLGRDIDEDRRRLHAVIDAAPGVRLRLDANQGWGVAEAIRIISGFEADGLPIDLVEQPVAAAALDGMAQVRAEVATPVMADESVWTAADARRIVDRGAADMLNIKLAKTGGIREALAIADIAHEAGLTCMVGAMMEPRISITAAAHLAFAHPAVTMIDLDSPEWFASRLPPGGYRIDAGRLTLTGGPGLGLDPLRPGDDPPALSPSAPPPAPAPPT